MIMSKFFILILLVSCATSGFATSSTALPEFDLSGLGAAQKVAVRTHMQARNAAVERDEKVQPLVLQGVGAALKARVKVYNQKLLEIGILSELPNSPQRSSASSSRDDNLSANEELPPKAFMDCVFEYKYPMFFCIGAVTAIILFKERHRFLSKS